ncbi:MAG TPA: hypothetical protein VMN78_09710 [Longimicrobiales bacterium]|nr:hypothetical protein [Longimicrobiales bacterium]
MHYSIATLVQQSDGLTLGEIIADIPHDAPAIFVYVLLAAGIAAIVAGSRRSSSGGKENSR